jgi:hypothetical protein
VAAIATVNVPHKRDRKAGVEENLEDYAEK